MLDDLGIKGIQPVNDAPDRQARNRGGGKKFSLEDESGEEGERAEKREARRKRKKKVPPSRPPEDGGPKDGSIDIIV